MASPRPFKGLVNGLLRAFQRAFKRPLKGLLKIFERSLKGLLHFKGLLKAL